MTRAEPSWRLRSPDSVAFDDAISVVFGQEVDFAGDPLGLDLAGKVSLLGGADKDGVVSAGTVVTAGSVLSVEVTDDVDGDGVLARPPLTVRSRGIDKNALRRGMVVTR